MPKFIVLLFNGYYNTIQFHDFNSGAFLYDRAIFRNGFPVIAINGYTSSMSLCINTFRYHSFSPYDSVGIGFYIFRFTIQKPHHDRSKENKGQQRDYCKNDNLPSDIGAQSSGQSRKARSNGEANGTEGSRKDFEDDKQNGDNEPNLIGFHNNVDLILQIYKKKDNPQRTAFLIFSGWL